MADLSKEWDTAKPVPLEDDWANATPITTTKPGGISDEERQRMAFVQSQGEPATVARYGAPYSNISFGKPRPIDTRKISYTDSGYRPNAPATDIPSFAKNFAQDLVEAPMMPIKAVADVLNAPDTGAAALEAAKSVYKVPAGYVPFLSEPVTGKTAAENWLTNPGYGALTALGVGELSKRPLSGAKSLLDSVVNTPERLDSAIEQGINKAVRPSVAGKSTFNQSTRYMDKAKDAVKTITLNKDNLNLTNEYGEPTGALPENLKQFSQAIEQTKGNIFQQYNDLAKQAGEQGVQVDLQPAARELNTIAGNKVLNDMNPGTAKYAAERAKTLSGRGKYSAEEAQQAIQTLNTSLDAFYKNPTYDTASRAYIDSLIANHLRQGLDSVIENTVGDGYQGLKNQYGALKSIEKDVNHRAVVDARRNNKGLLDFTDVFSGSQVISGLMHMNPGTVGAGIGAKMIASLYKLKNDPNRIVKAMFGNVDRQMVRPAPRPRVAMPAAAPPQPEMYFDTTTGTMRPRSNDPLGIRNQ